MKKRIAKKIINASEDYWYYCKYCNTRKKYKSNPYWTDKWDYYAFRSKYLALTIHWKVDERLDMALRRLPHYAKEIMKCEVKNKPTKRLRRCKAQH